MSPPLARLPAQAIPFSQTLNPRHRAQRICQRCAHAKLANPTRQFTTTRRRDAISKQMQMTNIDSKLPKHSSMRSQMKKAGAQQMGNDLGLLPQTLILPPSKDLPRWTDFKRWKIYYKRFTTSFKDFYSLVMFLKWEVLKDPITNKPLRKPLELNQRAYIAKDLHVKFHRLLANGDLKGLQQFCCEGLLKESRTRVERRKRMGYKYESWALIGYPGKFLPDRLNKWPFNTFFPGIRVVSDRLTPLPVAQSHMRQCIVRIRSIQTYTLAGDREPQTRKHTNYVVIQKISTKDDDGEWKLWGLTQPPTSKELEAIVDGDSVDTSITLADRFREQLARFTSSR